MKTSNIIRSLRLKLALALWPKDVRQGDLFTIVRHLKDGKPSTDGSWVGKTCRAERITGDTIVWSLYSEHFKQFEVVDYPLISGKNCEIKPIKIPLTKEEGQKLYNAAKSLL